MSHESAPIPGVAKMIVAMIDTADPKNWEVYRKSTGDGDGGGHGGGHH